MPRVSQVTNAWNAGELAPEIFGRTDIAKYRTGAKRIENMLVHPEGGAYRRHGTRFVAEEMDSTKKGRLIPFVFSTTQAYILEFGESKIRVYANDLQVGVEEHADLGSPTVAVGGTNTDEFSYTDHGYIDQQGPFHITATAGIPAPLAVDTDYWMSMPKTMTFTDAEVTAGAPGTITFTTAHGYVADQGPFRFTTTGLLPFGTGATAGAYVDYYVLYVSPTAIQLALTVGGAGVTLAANSTGTNTMTPTPDYLRDNFRLSATKGGTPIVISGAGTGPHTLTPNPVGSSTGLPLEILHPYSESQLYDIRFVQSADFLYLNHKDHRPAQLTRSGATKWAFDPRPITDGPFPAENSDAAITMASNNTAIGQATLNQIGGHDWVVADIGRLVRIRHGSNTIGYAEVTGVSTTTSAAAYIWSALNSTVATLTFNLGSWHTGNWPAAISFFEQRLGMSGEADTPQSLHGSQTSLYDSFAPTEPDNTVIDTDAVNFAIGLNQVNAIRWMALGNRLVIGTSNSLFTARGSFDGDPITPTNIQVERISAVGAASIQPVNISEQLIYITANHQSVRAFTLARDADIVTPDDLTLLAKHILGRTADQKVTTMAYQQDRQQVLWLTRTDGVMPTCTHVPEQQVTAWSRQILGGSFSTGDAVVESVAEIPNQTETHNQVWITVKRTVNGATVRHIEFFEDEWLSGTSTDMRYVDSAPAAYSGTAVSTISGLDHLEGETVQVFANGRVHPDRTVASGAITLDDNIYTDVVAGLKYTSELETLPFDFPDPEGSSQGKVARIDHISLNLYETIGGEYGRDMTDEHRYPIPYPDVLPEASDPIGTFSGIQKLEFEGDFDRNQTITFRQDKPLPFNLLSLTAMAKTGAR